MTPGLGVAWQRLELVCFVTRAVHAELKSSLHADPDAAQLSAPLLAAHKEAVCKAPPGSFHGTVLSHSPNPSHPTPQSHPPVLTPHILTASLSQVRELLLTLLTPISNGALLNQPPPLVISAVRLHMPCTRHTPHATRHTPHATRNTSHAIRHTPHARGVPHAERRTPFAHSHTPHARAQVRLVGAFGKALATEHQSLLEGCVRFVLQALLVPACAEHAAVAFRALCVHAQKQLGNLETVQVGA